MLLYLQETQLDFISLNDYRRSQVVQSTVHLNLNLNVLKARTGILRYSAISLYGPHQKRLS